MIIAKPPFRMLFLATERVNSLNEIQHLEIREAMQDMAIFFLPLKMWEHR